MLRENIRKAGKQGEMFIANLENKDKEKTKF